MNQSELAKQKLIMQEITVKYGDFTANDKVSLRVHTGETVALLGENGAGKSTLMKVLAGLVKPVSGRITIDGQRITSMTPNQSQKLGIGMVHQHFMLIPKLTVTENACIGYKPAGYPFPDKRKVARDLAELSEKFRLQINPNSVVSSLSVGAQQRVEILNALYRGANLLILDEPTSILTPQETSGLFEIIHSVIAQNHAVIFISHKLKEVLEISDRIVVLREGKGIADQQNRNLNQRDLAVLMVGRELSHQKNIASSVPDAKTLVNVSDISYTNQRKVKVLKRINLDIKAGEIHGIAGVDGNGQTELAGVMAGIIRPDSGRILLNGKDVTNVSPRKRIDAGLAHIPGDRHKIGVILDLNLEENFILENCGKPPISKYGVINPAEIADFSHNLIGKYDIRCNSTRQKVSTLSGGNQQKLVVARELSRSPVFIIAMQPCRGLDVGATEFIYKMLIEQRNHGKSILLISTELDEILDLSDRISVIYEGKIVKTMHRDEATRESLGLLMSGKSNE